MVPPYWCMRPPSKTGWWLVAVVGGVHGRICFCFFFPPPLSSSTCFLLFFIVSFISMHVEALHKRHSTVGEAIDVGTRMAAHCIVLTHFSQRYPKVPTLPSAARIGIAFDLMAVPFSELPGLPSLLPALPDVFPPDDEVG